MNAWRCELRPAANKFHNLLAKRSLSTKNASIIKSQVGPTFQLIKKTYQFINVVNGVSHSHETANIFFHLTQ